MKILVLLFISSICSSVWATECFQYSPDQFSPSSLENPSWGIESTQKQRTDTSGIYTATAVRLKVSGRAKEQSCMYCSTYHYRNVRDGTVFFGAGGNMPGEPPGRDFCGQFPKEPKKMVISIDGFVTLDSDVDNVYFLQTCWQYAGKDLEKRVGHQLVPVGKVIKNPPYFNFEKNITVGVFSVHYWCKTDFWWDIWDDVQYFESYMETL